MKQWVVFSFSIACCVWMVADVVTCAGNLTLDSTCGVSRGCYHDCRHHDNTEDCHFMITWVYREFTDTVDFTMSMALSDMFNPQWFAIAFSDDDMMGDDSVVQCITDGHMRIYADVSQSYNGHYYNMDLKYAKYGLREIWGRMEDGLLTCSFTRLVRLDMDKIFDLDRPWYILVANGYMQHGSKLRHRLFHDGPFVSPKKVNLMTNENVNGQLINYLVKAHGSMMIFAWVILASISIVLARFYKQQWPMGRACDRRVWYQVHKIFMLLTTVLVLVAFILIWVKTKGYSQIRGGNSFQRAHPVLGTVIMSLTILNPVMGFLRPKSGSASRSIFKYLHTFIGTTVYVLAVLNIILGASLAKSSSPDALLWVLVAFAAYQLMAELIYEAHECYLIKSGRLSDYEMKELSAIRRDSITSINAPPPGTFFKNVVLAIHITALLTFGIVAIVLLAT